MPRLLLIQEEQGHGGIHTVLQTLHSALVAQGWQITTLSVRPWPAGPRALWQAWQAWRMARSSDVLLASNNFRPAYVAVLLGAWARRPAVVWVHGPLQAVLGSERPRTLKHRLLHRLYRHGQLVCVSQSSRTSLLAWMNCPDLQAKVQVILNPAPPLTPSLCESTATAAAPEAAEASGWIDLGFVARLSTEKRPGWLLEALRLLPPHIRLNVVGDGPLMPELQAAGAELARAGRLRWHGALPVQPTTYANWQLTLLCSAYEGYPMVALESMAAGVPCVATPLPALREMLGTEGTEWLAAEDSPAALAQKVLDVLQTAPEARRARALAIARRHDATAFGQQWHALLLAQTQAHAQARAPQPGGRA